METAPGVAFDLDGDGTYETDGPTATLQLDPGTHELGVRAQDADGAATVSRRTVDVHASPFEIVPPPALVRPGAPVTLLASAPGAVWDTDDGRGRSTTSPRTRSRSPASTECRHARPMAASRCGPSPCSPTTAPLRQ